MRYSGLILVRLHSYFQPSKFAMAFVSLPIFSFKQRLFAFYQFMFDLAALIVWIWQYVLFQEYIFCSAPPSDIGIDLGILGWLMSLESSNFVVVDLLSIPAMLLRKGRGNRVFLLMKEIVNQGCWHTAQPQLKRSNVSNSLQSGKVE